MKIIGRTEKSDIATVYLGEFEDGKTVEFVESVQPPLDITDKWVLIVSSLIGCPVKCPFCDSGWHYKGKLSKEEIFSQIDFLIKQKFPDKKINSRKFKIQFARAGDPALNMAVIEVLTELPKRYNTPGLLPSVSTVAPITKNDFFENLIEIKNTIYKENFQMQFSIHSTDENERDRLIPVKKWSLKDISNYGSIFRQNRGKKISLNFALYKDFKINPYLMSDFFSASDFILKFTPLNPTIIAMKNNFSTERFESPLVKKLIETFQFLNFETIISIGESEENKIGSNCGQFLMQNLNSNINIKDAYLYKIEKFN